MEKIINDLIYLCKCAINGVTPDKEIVAEMDIDGLYKLGQEHTIVAIVAYALESAGVSSTKFRQAKEKAIRKNMLFDCERKALFDYMEEQGIWYMPLKGSLLKDMYPKLGMRQMSDNDILFNAKYKRKIKRYFVDAGYTVHSYGRGAHDEYEKPPVLHMEMHRELFSVNQKLFRKHYRNVKEHLVKDDGNKYGYHFTDEDFYVYLIVHEYKHFMYGGIGIRSLLDVYLYTKCKKETLDWNYIEKKCNELQVAEFEKRGKKLAYKLFGTEENEDFEENLTEDEKQMLGLFVSAGTYGTNDRMVENEFRKTSTTENKWVYYFKRVFTVSGRNRAAHPIIYKSIVLIPFYWIFRIVRGALFRRKKIADEIRIVKKIKENKKT